MTKTISGLDIIRDALMARKGNLAVLARDVGVSASALDDFAQGNRETLPVENIHAIVQEIWHGYVEFLPEQNLLSSVEQPPARSMGTVPVLTMKLPQFTPGPNRRGGPQPEIAAPKPKPRQGWKGIWE